MIILAYAFLTCGILFNLLFGNWFLAAALAFSMLTVWASDTGRKPLDTIALVLTLVIGVPALIWNAVNLF